MPAPGAQLHWLDDAAHDPTHPGMVQARVGVLDHWATIAAWSDEVWT